MSYIQQVLKKMFFFTIFALMFLPSLSSSAEDLSSCSKYKAPSFLEDIHYFDKNFHGMTQYPTDHFTLVHNDDARIIVDVSLQSIPPKPPVTRSDYIQEIEKDFTNTKTILNLKNTTYQTSIFPYDPISWNITATTRNFNSEYPLIYSQTTIRIDPRCHLLVKWTAEDVPLLRDRIQQVISSVDAIRIFSEQKSTKADFIVDTHTPKGKQAITINYIIPFFVSLSLFYILISSLYFSPPNIFLKSISLTFVITSLFFLYYQYSNYKEDIVSGKYVDQLLIFTTMIIMSIVSVIPKFSRSVTLFNFTLSITFGLSFLTSSYFQWLPDTTLGLSIGIYYIMSGIIGITLWQNMFNAETGKIILRKHGQRVLR